MTIANRRPTVRVAARFRQRQCSSKARLLGIERQNDPFDVEESSRLSAFANGDESEIEARQPTVMTTGDESIRHFRYS
jgi:hypothetical protein